MSAETHSQISEAEKLYKAIKKQNGEGFAQVIRGGLPTLNGLPNILKILEYAGRDPKDAKRLLPTLNEIRNKAVNTDSVYKDEIKDPITLLNEAGYHAFYVNSLAEQNSIKKYFRPVEELCTFDDPDRYKFYYMIDIVKKEVWKDREAIKPSQNQQREDEYGRSVSSIQILKTGGFISIKNRYNHTVDSPDATFNNNPDEIILGLSESLKKYFNVDFMTSEPVLPTNYRFVHEQLVRYKYEENNVYIDDDHYFSGSNITKINKDYEIFFDDGLILDNRNSVKGEKKLRSVIPDNKTYEVLQKEIGNNELKISKLADGTHVLNIEENGRNKELCRIKDGKITALHLYKITTIGHGFLKRNRLLQTLEIPELTKMDRGCFENNTALTLLRAPKLQEMGMYCFKANTGIANLEIAEPVLRFSQNHIR